MSNGKAFALNHSRPHPAATVQASTHKPRRTSRVSNTPLGTSPSFQSLGPTHPWVPSRLLRHHKWHKAPTAPRCPGRASAVRPKCYSIGVPRVCCYFARGPKGRRMREAWISAASLAALALAAAPLSAQQRAMPTSANVIACSGNFAKDSSYLKLTTAFGVAPHSCDGERTIVCRGRRDPRSA